MSTSLSIFSSGWAGMLTGIFGLIGYIFGAIGLYTLAKRRAISYAWIAWIPGVQVFLVGDLIGDELWGIHGARWILLFGGMVAGLIAIIPFLGWAGYILQMLYYIFMINAFNKLFAIYRPQSALVITIIGIFVPVLFPIWCFVIRNDSAGYSVY